MLKEKLRLNKNNKVILVASVIALLLVQQGLRIPSWTFFLDALNNSMHVPLFMAITYLLTRYIPDQPGKVLLICLLLAVGSELLQGLTSRQASFSDILLDVTGVVAILALRHWQHWLVRIGVLALTFLVAALQPLWVVVAHDYRYEMWPALIDLSDPRGSVLTHTNSVFKIVSPPDTWVNAPEKVILVTLADVPWPGFHLQEVLGDWQDQQYLVISLYISGTEALDLFIGVRERNRRRTTAYVEMRLKPGAQVLRIPREDLAPGTTRIRDVLIYTHQKDAGRQFFVGEVKLSGLGNL